MKTLLLVATASLLSLGCGTTHVVDGGLVDGDGWPQRPAANRFRCPDETFLVDSLSASGRRLVLCRSVEARNSRGFELTWSPEGQLVSHLELTAAGTPIGRTQWFDDGTLSSEESYSDGKLVRKLGYHENGNLRVEVAYDTERDVTLVRRLAPDGSLEQAGAMRDGRQVGTWKEWRDGAMETLSYIDGVAQGGVERVYPDGGIESGQYADGARTGEWVRLDSRGNPVVEANYQAGLLDGPYRAFHPNTQVRKEGGYAADQKHGHWRTWYPSGELATDVWYVCGKLSGPYLTYHPDGSPHIVGAYESGRKVGEWKTFNDVGIAASIEQHEAPSAPFDADAIAADGAACPP